MGGLFSKGPSSSSASLRVVLQDGAVRSSRVDVKSPIPARRGRGSAAARTDPVLLERTELARAYGRAGLGQKARAKDLQGNSSLPLFLSGRKLTGHVEVVFPRDRAVVGTNEKFTLHEHQLLESLQLISCGLNGEVRNLNLRPNAVQATQIDISKTLFDRRSFSGTSAAMRFFAQHSGGNSPAMASIRMPFELRLPRNLPPTVNLFPLGPDITYTLSVRARFGNVFTGQALEDSQKIAIVGKAIRGVVKKAPSGAAESRVGSGWFGSVVSLRAALELPKAEWVAGERVRTELACVLSHADVSVTHVIVNLVLTSENLVDSSDPKEKVTLISERVNARSENFGPTTNGTGSAGMTAIDFALPEAVVPTFSSETLRISYSLVFEVFTSASEECQCTFGVPIIVENEELVYVTPENGDIESQSKGFSKQALATLTRKTESIRRRARDVIAETKPFSRKAPEAMGDAGRGDGVAEDLVKLHESIESGVAEETVSLGKDLRASSEKISGMFTQQSERLRASISTGSQTDFASKLATKNRPRIQESLPPWNLDAVRLRGGRGWSPEQDGFQRLFKKPGKTFDADRKKKSFDSRMRSQSFQLLATKRQQKGGQPVRVVATNRAVSERESLRLAMRSAFDGPQKLEELSKHCSLRTQTITRSEASSIIFELGNEDLKREGLRAMKNCMAQSDYKEVARTVSGIY